jgi:molecular chaperone GrpE
MAKEQSEKLNDESEEKEEEHVINSAAEEQEDNCAELKEQLLRLAAEFDNYKKRVKKDIDNAEANGKAVLVKSMLPILDEFQLAMLAINEAKDTNIAKGIELLYSNFIGALRKEGLEEIETDGTFDPQMHEIMMVKESKEGDGTILEVIRKGYTFNDKLIRPASVRISKKIDENKNDKNNI